MTPDYILGRKLLRNIPLKIRRELERHITTERLDQASQGGSKLIYVRLPVTAERTRDDWVEIRYRDYTYDQRDAESRLISCVCGKHWLLDASPIYRN